MGEGIDGSDGLRTCISLSYTAATSIEAEVGNCHIELIPHEMKGNCLLWNVHFNKKFEVSF